MCEPVGREGMPARVGWPLDDPGALLISVQELAEILWADWSGLSFVGLQPRSQRGPDLDMTAGGRLGHPGRNFNQIIIGIDFRPVQAVQLGCAHAGESCNRPKRQSFWASIAEQAGKLFRG